MASSRLREYFNVQYQPGERKLVRKIDFFILTFCCLSYFVNYVSPRRPDQTASRHVADTPQLDRSNLANAYVSGMKTDLGFVGNQLNEINTCFTVG
jgi:ACS family pantothenate transporter-like MFS transporter